MFLKLFVCAAVFVSNSAFAAEPQATDPKMQEMMKKIQEAGSPGAPHKMLAELAGNWTFTGKNWESPKAKPHENKGTAVFTMILGGRWLQQELKSEMMGMSYEGHGMVGYDNVEKEYKSVWVDNMNTGVTLGEGTYDAKSKTLKDKGEFSCPISGKEQDYRSDWKIVDKNNMVFAMYAKAPDGTGPEFKQMEITYKRAK